MIIHLSSFCLLFNLIDAQFPDHYDLEKLGEVDYRNEKYKILRPALHRIRDHFKNVMMRRETESNDEPQTKLLMDENGFRHYWSTLDEPISRKSEDPTADVNNNDINKETEVDADPKPKKKRPRKITRDDFYQDVRDQAAEDEKEALRQAKPPPPKPGGKQMYLVEATMFCPHFGVIKTRHYIKKESAAPAAPTAAKT